MAGATRIGESTHTVESRIGLAIEHNEHAEPLFEELEKALDQVAEWVDALHQRLDTQMSRVSAAPRPSQLNSSSLR